MLEKIKDAHVIGIRSKTKLTKQVLEQAKNLLAIGCFCIGTNQVDLQAAANQGVRKKEQIMSTLLMNPIDCCLQLSLQ